MRQLFVFLLVALSSVSAVAQEAEPETTADPTTAPDLTAAPAKPDDAKATPPPDAKAATPAPAPAPEVKPAPPPVTTSDADKKPLPSGPPVPIVVTLESNDPGVQDLVSRVEGALISALGRDGRFAPVIVDLGTGEPPKEDLSEAQKHIAAAKAAYEGLDLDGAITEYAAAVKVYLAHPFSADPKALAEVFVAWGATYQLNGDKAHADAVFRFALALAPDAQLDKATYGPDILAAFVAQKAALDKAQADSPSTLTLDLDGASHAEVFIDGKSVGHAPLRGLKLYPGRHLLVAKEPGYAPLGQVVNLAAGEDTPVKAALEETEAHKTFASALAHARSEMKQPTSGPGSEEAATAAKAELVVIGTLSSAENGTQIDVVLMEPSKHVRLAGVTRTALVESRQFPSVMDSMALELGNDYVDPPDNPFGDDGTGGKPLVKRWYFWAGVGVATALVVGAAAVGYHDATERPGLPGGAGTALGLP